MAKEDVSRRVRSMLEDYLADKELEIYDLQYRKEGKDWKLRVILDKPIGCETEYVNINECEEVTRFLSDRLDEEDFIERAYMLEVSSPGLDRELIHDQDFERFAGRMVDVKLYEALNGEKQIEAELVGKTEEDIIELKIDDEMLTLPKKKIASIRLAVIF